MKPITPGLAFILLPLVLHLSLALPADDAPSVSEVEVHTSETDLVASTAHLLSISPETAQALAQRILLSKISKDLAPSESSEQALGTLLEWIQANSVSAAHLAIGFAKDDATGTNAFEESLHTRIRRRFEISPNRYKGLLGRLRQTAIESEHLTRELFQDEQKREILKRWFEGQSTPTGTGGSPTVSGARRYDRLSAHNPSGYSPEVLSYQSEMNIHRVPGAPKLPETGKLDYTTLRYPYYSLRHALDRFQRMEKSPQASGDSVSQQRVFRAIEKAESALKEFDSEAEKTKNPAHITPKTLKILSAKRSRVALWINIAALEEQILHLKSQQGFMKSATKQLNETLEKIPIDGQTRRLYLERGQELQRRVNAAIDDTSRICEILETGHDTESSTETDRLVQSIRRRNRKLSQEIERYAEIPKKFLGLKSPPSRWRAWIERWIQRLTSQ